MMRLLRVTVALLALGAAPGAIGHAQAPASAPVSAARSAALPYKQRADALARNGQLDLAAREYRTALSIDGSYAEAQNELATLYAAQGKLSMAITTYRLALTQLADFPLARYNLAYALRKAGRFPEAATEYRRFLRTSPRDADGHFGLGETLKALGDKAGAAAAFARYVELETRPEEAQWVTRARQEVATAAAAGVVPNPVALTVQDVVSAPAPRPLAAAPAPTATPAPRSLATAPAPTASPAPGPLAAAPVASPLPQPIASPAPAEPATAPRPLAAAPVASPLPQPIAAPAPAAPTTAPRPLATPAREGADTRALLAAAEEAFRLRQFALARDRLEAAATAAPARAEVQYKLAAARAATGDLRAALTAWEAVLRLEPGNEAAQDYALRAREKLGLLAPIAADRAPSLHVANPGSAPVARAHALGRAFARSGERPVLLAQAEALMAVGRYTEAQRLFLEAAALQSGDPLPYYHLAVCLRRLGDADQSAYYARLYLRAANAAEPGAQARIRVATRWAQAAPR